MERLINGIEVTHEKSIVHKGVTATGEQFSD
jgi:hypothetical protein